MTIRILYYNEGENPAEWLPSLEKRPCLRPRSVCGRPGDNAPADYALVWICCIIVPEQNRIESDIQSRCRVDSLLAMSHAIDIKVPIFRLEDAGMAIQMANMLLMLSFATIAVLTNTKNRSETVYGKCWPRTSGQISSASWAWALWGPVLWRRHSCHSVFHLRGWSRHIKNIPGIACYAGKQQMQAFLDNVRILVCVLPLLPKRKAYSVWTIFRYLGHGAYLINAGRGKHLVENDLLEAMRTGPIRAATLDVTGQEPLPPDHPFWNHAGITITPHIAALTFCHEPVRRGRPLHPCPGKEGEKLTSQINPERGY